MSIMVLCDVIDMLSKAKVVIILQYIHVSNQPFVYLKLT